MDARERASWALNGRRKRWAASRPPPGRSASLQSPRCSPRFRATARLASGTQAQPHPAPAVPFAFDAAASAVLRQVNAPAALAAFLLFLPPSRCPFPPPPPPPWVCVRLLNRTDIQRPKLPGDPQVGGWQGRWENFGTQSEVNLRDKFGSGKNIYVRIFVNILKLKS